ncbi:MAG TPA: bifunctional 3-deoxy-7-phosphoheptulonate synthase/chorismate mutase type II [Chitinophagaceae bacterium]|nr:bifunctional 3-deoxy-7-phosphoheptulonate synthase/chorismate mutase type II [Chitinophagaceae bacterium]HNF72291.1 bifunctional 3-deoxy-7-phosphoheptulonate synthase/chorismate mutase type II [Chitinophagaceae bacterium]
MNRFRQHKPFIIAGPCGIEDEVQLESMAAALSTLPVHMMRGGVWKPRSKPGMFEGRGEEALQWIQDLKRRYPNLPVCTEVAGSEQVELALRYGVDAVWIGARSSVNPFLVQEIADALKGTSLGVMIKNPVNPDVELWSGGIERLLKSGITHLAAIHRGFSSYDIGSKYRNKPIWAIPIELKRRYADLPVFCDVSHICGNRELLLPVAQRAMDLDFDGLMIESHPHPDQALSDAAQQITPDRLNKLLQHLVLRQGEATDGSGKIEEIRQMLDSMDAELVELIGKRMDMVKILGEIKAQNNMPIYQAERWRDIVESRTGWGQHSGLDALFITQLFQLIHDKSIQTQIAILNSLTPDLIKGKE